MGEAFALMESALDWAFKKVGLDWAKVTGNDKRQFIAEKQKDVKRCIDSLTRECEEFEDMIYDREAEMRESVRRKDMISARSQAREIVQIRKQLAVVQGMKCNMSAAELQMRTMRSLVTAAEGLHSVSMGMALYNSQVSATALNQVIRSFDMQFAALEAKTTDMQEALEDTTFNDEVDQDTDELVQQMVDEMNLKVREEMEYIPGSGSRMGSSKSVVATAEESQQGEASNSLQSRLQGYRPAFLQQ